MLGHHSSPTFPKYMTQLSLLLIIICCNTFSLARYNIRDITCIHACSINANMCVLMSSYVEYANILMDTSMV